MDDRFKNVTGGTVGFYDDGSTVIKLDVKSDKPVETFAPTATFRWAKSSPSAPPVLQQKWIRFFGDPFYRKESEWEWREVETVVLSEEPAPKGCERCARGRMLDRVGSCESCPF